MLRPAPRFLLSRAWLAAVLLLAAPPALTAQHPAQLTDQQFWKLVTEASEPDGFFQSDNLVSNELTMQHIIPALLKGRTNAAYLGVGPDQNFTYIAALRPAVAFIVDIRRGAMLQHLMYKALFEIAEDRATFLSLLFSRPRPAGLGASSTPLQLLEAFYPVAPDSTMYWRTRRMVEERLVGQHGFALSSDDLAGIDFVFTSFYLGGLDITYNYGASSMRGGRGMPSFADLMAATDAQGTGRGFLSEEANYAYVRQMHLRNLIVPVVGDFAGPKALRAIGAYLREHGVTVGAVYTSNVEQYLFRDPPRWRPYYENVATLPLDSGSVFVRAVFNMGFAGGGTGARSVTLLQPVLELLSAFREGRVDSYYAVVMMSRAER